MNRGTPLRRTEEHSTLTILITNAGRSARIKWRKMKKKKKKKRKKNKHKFEA